ncbi:MAG: hypothetical protein J2P28_06570 [Actinobacteria bacterium]|nr:hypothetical protein [Actinomycetota bacterium]
MFGEQFNGDNLTTFNVNALSQPGGPGTPVNGSISNIKVHAHTVAGPVACSFNATGKAFGSYNNSDGGVLSVSRASLSISSVKGCGGIIQNGDSATFHGPLTIHNATSGHPVINHNSE